jgi:hypothetical protein
MATKIKTYLQDLPKDWLKRKPHEKWRCDIFPDDWSDHHGVAETEAGAIHNASLAYLSWITPPENGNLKRIEQFNDHPRKKYS